MLTTSHQIGDQVTLTANFVDENDDPIDPTTVVLGLIPPTGAYEVIEVGPGGIENPGVGEYRYQLTAEASGKHRYRWLAAGAAVEAREGYFWVDLSAMADVGP